MAEDQATKHFISGDEDDFEDDKDIMITGIVSPSPSQEFVFSNGFAELVQTIIHRDGRRKNENTRISSSNQSKSFDPNMKSHTVRKLKEEVVEKPELIVDLTSEKIVDLTNENIVDLTHEIIVVRTDEKTVDVRDEIIVDLTGEKIVDLKEEIIIDLGDEINEDLPDEVIVDLTDNGQERADHGRGFNFSLPSTERKPNVILQGQRLALEHKAVQNDLSSEQDYYAQNLTPASQSKVRWCCDCGEIFSTGGRPLLQWKLKSDVNPFQCKKCQVKPSYDKSFTDTLGMNDKSLVKRKHVRNKDPDSPPTKRMTRANKSKTKPRAKSKSNDNNKKKLVQHERTRKGQKTCKRKQCDTKVNKTTRGRKKPTQKKTTQQKKRQGQRRKFKLNDSGKNLYPCNNSEPHNGDNMLNCGECGKNFKHLQGLAVHWRRMHDKYRAFKCNGCGEKFSSIQTLIAHLRKHNEN